ncbi:MAG: glycosyltransferase family 2 protein [Gammaproteobacteria bacterium]|nr:glycosyltransferase family 2 protein [Gammaproteobacteria bacterium]MDH3434784.1 glycosyltransferase family 2 protein [Gammaproteobacteria bacterium]
MPALDILIPAFNAEHCLEDTLEAVFAQTVPAELLLGVVVVNNRSTDNTAKLIARWADKGVRRVDQLDIQGRGATINAGAAASTADYILILDADCRLVGKECLRLLGRTMAEGIDAGFGYATGPSDNFWGRYRRRLEADRLVVDWQGWTTACCLVKRDAFAAAGGFSTGYEHYGFEDRDFICRLRSIEPAAELRSLPDLQAEHDDDTTAQDVFEKMYQSGRYSSGVFKSNFPNEYLATVYARVDVDTAPAHMLWTLRLLQPLQSMFERIASYLTKHRNTPLAFGRPFIKLCSALSYFRGTVDRARQQ